MSIVGGLLRLQTTSHTPAKRRLAGETRVNNTGSSKRIVIIHRDTLTYIGSTVSESSGSWELHGLPETLTGGDVFVVHLDDTRSFDPIAFDNVTLVE